MFATASGDVRRNKLSDFVNVTANGKIAMKLEEGDRLIGVAACTETDDVLLRPRRAMHPLRGQPMSGCSAAANSTGVRGIRLAEGDEVISMSILRHIEAIRRGARGLSALCAAPQRRGAGEEEGERRWRGSAAKRRLTPGALCRAGAAEQFILTVTANGYGKRTSAYEYRITSRGGQGIVNMAAPSATADVVASFPVEDSDQIMLVTDGGQLIRCPVDDIRIAGRSTQGVVVFKMAEGERVVSVTRLAEDDAGARADEAESDASRAASASIPAPSTPSPPAISTSSGAPPVSSTASSSASRPTTARGRCSPSPIASPWSRPK